MPVVRRQKYSLSEVTLGAQHPISLDYMKTQFLASAAVDIVSGTAEYLIEYTVGDFTNILGDSKFSDLRWHALPGLSEGQTETQLVKIDYPVTGIRLNIQSMTGTLEFTVIQGIHQ